MITTLLIISLAFNAVLFLGYRATKRTAEHNQTAWLQWSDYAIADMDYQLDMMQNDCDLLAKDNADLLWENDYLQDQIENSKYSLRTY